MAIVKLLCVLLMLPAVMARAEQVFNSAPSINGPAMPIEVRSSETGDITTAVITGVLDLPFPSTSGMLSDPARWCEFLPLSFNIKSCTYQTENGQTWVTVYAGRKIYQELDDTHQLRYRFDVEKADTHRLQVVLAAEAGPLGTRDLRIELTATPLDNATTLRVHVSQRSSVMSRLAMQSYLATLGKDKVGFSVGGHTKNGEPIYVKGVKGVIERNGVRYFLAMQAYTASHTLPAADRLAARLRIWFDLTERYPRQLHEMEWDDYRRAKELEWHNQRRLQVTLDTGATP